MINPIELLPEKNIWVVKVQKNSYNHDVFYGNRSSEWIFTYEIGLHEYDHEFIDNKLPKGNWSIIGVGVNEEVGGKIVEMSESGTKLYKDYEKLEIGITHYNFKNPEESLISLLKSKGLNPEDNFVFLELKKD